MAAAVGVKSDTLDRIEMLVSAGADAVVIDTAHGHSVGVLGVIAKACEAFKNRDIQIVAGNVATGEGAKALADAGVSAVKVGIGPGSICTTRIIAGVGMPQLTAVMLASKALEGTGVPVIADGGIRYSGDIVKALAAGASTIMAGSLFAGTEESPGETIILNGRKFKAYRGMGSLEAMEHGSKDRYFQDMEEDIKKLVPEGIVAQVPFKGTVSEVVYQLVGGLFVPGARHKKAVVVSYRYVRQGRDFRIARRAVLLRRNGAAAFNERKNRRRMQGNYGNVYSRR